MGVECKQLELAFDQLLSDNHRHVIVDLSNVTKLDSGGLGKLVNCFSRLKNCGAACFASPGTTGMIDGVLKLAPRRSILESVSDGPRSRREFLRFLAIVGQLALPEQSMP